MFLTVLLTMTLPFIGCHGTSSNSGTAVMAAKT